ncbi:hypothetical protein L6452_06170 [Arctium lappa]|uniref:Uncharacterized protein n=1 Tax=Arctium lappa TaxID=4217 RepID=A0ACB9EHT5_ARCLA|nr:hypothetical protein L6452_06170 [Arctium lappa]
MLYSRRSQVRTKDVKVSPHGGKHTVKRTPFLPQLTTGTPPIVDPCSYSYILQVIIVPINFVPTFFLLKTPHYCLLQQVSYRYSV